ncbi:MAG TPA: DUF2064 domain-containing protein [Thermoanaerobaculia bacterium]|nr:DUF2064 domain-containing protein [Thermoanaerobaculia bacterium]
MQPRQRLEHGAEAISRRTAIVLFRGDPRREERQKELPARFLSTIHRTLFGVLSSLDADLFTVDGIGDVSLRGRSSTFRYRASTLGAAVGGALDRCASAGYGRIILVAGDTPAISRSIVAAALDHLANSRSAVIGRTEDGGFYLAGFSAPPALGWDDILRDPSTAAQSLRSASESLGFDTVELPPAIDVDGRQSALRAVRRHVGFRGTRLLFSVLESLLTLRFRSEPRAFPAGLVSLGFTSLRAPPTHV